MSKPPINPATHPEIAAHEVVLTVASTVAASLGHTKISADSGAQFGAFFTALHDHLVKHYRSLGNP